MKKFTHMNEFLTESNIQLIYSISNKILISFFGACIALFLKHFYDVRRREKELKRVRKALVDIINNIVLDSLNDINEGYEDLISNYKGPFDFKPSEFIIRENYISSKLLSFFIQKDLLELFSKAEIEISELYKPFHCLDIYNELNPFNIQHEYISEYNELLIKYEKKYDVPDVELKCINEVADEVSYNYSNFIKKINTEKSNNIKLIKEFETLSVKLH